MFNLSRMKKNIHFTYFICIIVLLFIILYFIGNTTEGFSAEEKPFKERLLRTIDHNINVIFMYIGLPLHGGTPACINPNFIITIKNSDNESQEIPIIDILFGLKMLKNMIIKDFDDMMKNGELNDNSAMYMNNTLVAIDELLVKNNIPKTIPFPIK